MAGGIYKKNKVRTIKIKDRTKQFQLDTWGQGGSLVTALELGITVH